MSHLKIITGHYGSGKTEFCLNYAMQKKRLHARVAIVDADIVNPYFRSREKSEMLIDAGIEIVGSSTGLNQGVDLPALPREIYGYIDDCECLTVFDAGGDGAGARILSRYAEKIGKYPYDMYVVVNANRPMSATVGQACQYIEDIQAQSRLSVSGIINTTHMLRDTQKEDVMRGAALCRQITQVNGIPLVYNVIPKHLSYMSEEGLANPFILEEYYMRPDWL